MIRAALAPVAVGIVAALAACSHEPRRRREAPVSATRADAGPPDAAPGGCVDQCVRDRQMVAASIDAIVADCRRACAASSR